MVTSRQPNTLHIGGDRKHVPWNRVVRPATNLHGWRVSIDLDRVGYVATVGDAAHNFLRLLLLIVTVNRPRQNKRVFAILLNVNLTERTQWSFTECPLRSDSRLAG